ncbi:MAG: TetR/AcrR family transcriptional regulator [Devosia sp.]
MGHKDDLLAGAKKCLLELGYAKTTARDIVAVSKTNLASIGYHFGSKDALLTEAMMELIGEWGETFAAAAAGPSAKTTEARFRAVWRQVLALFETDRKVLLVSFDIAVQAARTPELQAIFAASYRDVRPGLVDDFLGVELDGKTRKAVGGLLLALLSGMTVQYLLDPEGAPTADELTLAMKTIGRAFAGKD